MPDDFTFNIILNLNHFQSIAQCALLCPDPSWRLHVLQVWSEQLSASAELLSPGPGPLSAAQDDGNSDDSKNWGFITLKRKKKK